MKQQAYRTASGGLINRRRSVNFHFNDQLYQGYEGDTLASALLANGVHMVGRSFKYHRPRGLVGAGAEDPAALVQIGEGGSSDPNTRATEQEIWPGLRAFAQNCWPSLDYDIGAINDAFARFMPAGFYYKTFMGPPIGWMMVEPIIRAAAGLGRCPSDPDPDIYESINRHCDVLVIGGGAAGLMAAFAAAQSGARVILCEETAALGGQLLSAQEEAVNINDMPAKQWVEGVTEKLQTMGDVTLLSRTCAFGYYGQNFIGLWEKVSDHLPPSKRDSHLPRQRLWRVRAKRVILATGAIERFPVFHENDRPGIMLSGAAATYLHRYGVKAGEKVALFANNDRAWQTAFDLQDAGAKIVAIIDTRQAPHPARRKVALERDIAVYVGSVVDGTSGRKRISSAYVRQREADGSAARASLEIDCDMLAVSAGWSANVALFSQSRGQLRFDERNGSFVPGRSFQAENSIGAANGTFDLQAALSEAIQAGLKAADETGFPVDKPSQPTVTMKNDPSINGIEPIGELPSFHPSGKTRAFVDLQDDVMAKDLKLAVREGYKSVEHAKRYTTMGMGTDQGKISNLNAFSILGKEQGKTIPEVGVTTFRQPYKPVTIGALAGQHVNNHFMPRRTTPMHIWHRANHAVFEPVGDWLRARAYIKDGESFDKAVQREALAARASVGMLDASTLGKIDIKGKDARLFLNRVYTNAWSKLEPGRCRYGLMLNEDGMVYDDGVTACLGDDHFHMTTTTGGAANVLATLEDYLQTEWPDLEVYLTTTTEQWAVASLCGPKSRAVVEAVLDDFNGDPETFPFMAWRDATMEGIPVRVFRISFTGELSYEINIPASYGMALWERLMTAGKPHDITPYGTEAMHLLRAEKGFIIVGQETDGTVTPYDLRMGWAVSTKKGDFIGKRSLYRSNTTRSDRKQYVGLLTEDPNLVLKEGAHVIATDEEPAPPVPMLGHVTSSYFSPNLKRSIALAMVRSGGEKIGKTLWISQRSGEPIPVLVTEVDFLSMEEGVNG